MPDSLNYEWTKKLVNFFTGHEYACQALDFLKTYYKVHENRSVLPEYELLKETLKLKDYNLARFFLTHFTNVRPPKGMKNANTPLHYAALLDTYGESIIKTLIQKGASIYAVNENNETPLHTAAKYHSPLLKCLLSYLTGTNCPDLIVDHHGLSIFHIACMAKNAGRLKQLLNMDNRNEITDDLYIAHLSNPINADSPFLPGYTPLHISIKYRSKNSFNFLIKTNIDMNVKNSNGETPLHLLFSQQAEDRIFSINCPLYSLLNTMAKKEIKNVIDKNGLSHLHIACSAHHFDMIIKLLNLKNSNHFINLAVNSNAESCPGYTPLHFLLETSISWHNRNHLLKVCNMMIKNNLDIYIQNEKKLTALHLGFESNNDVMVDWILSNLVDPDINPADENGVSFLHIACMRNHEGAIAFYMQGNIDTNAQIPSYSLKWQGFTPLHLAVEFRSLKVIEILVLNGADECKINSKGLTPLQFAFYSGYDDCIDVLLKSMQNFRGNPSDSNGLTHFHIACTRDNKRVIEMFLHADISVNLEISETSEIYAKYSPLHLAVEYSRINAVEFLLEKGADVNAKNSQGATPLHLGCRNYKSDIYGIVFQVFSNSFKEKGVSFTEGNLLAHFPAVCKEKKLEKSQIDIIHLLIQYQSDINAEDSMGNTALFYVYKNPFSYPLTKNSQNTLNSVLNDELCKWKREIIMVLLEENIDVTKQNSDGNNILHTIANSKEKIDSADIEMIKMIIKQGCSFVSLNKLNSSVLQLACQNGHKNLVELLIDYNVDLNAHTESTFPPVFLATEEGYIDIVNVLLNNGVNIYWKLNGQSIFQRIRSYFGNTTFPSAMDFIKLFVHYGCSLNEIPNSKFQSYYWQPILFPNMELFLKLGADIDVFMSNYSVESIKKTPSKPEIVQMQLYLTKLSFLGYEPSERTRRIYEEYIHIVSANSELNKNWASFKQECINELYKLNQIKVNDYCSLYDLLYKNQINMIGYVRNPYLKEELADPQFDTNFKLYGYILKALHRKSSIRRNLMESAIEALEIHTAGRLPSLIYEDLFKYFNFEMLYNLSKCREIEVVQNATPNAELPSISSPKRLKVEVARLEM